VKHENNSLYYQEAQRLSNIHCANPRCTKNISQLSARYGDLFCSRACHDEVKGITHKALADIVGGVDGG
jgi:hypothetical protein